MKKSLLFLILLPIAALGQIQYPYILNPATVAPSGACAGPQIQVLGSNGAVYTCNNGTWSAATSGGSAGTVTSVALTGSANLFSSTPGTAVTTSGTLNVDSQLATQTANCVLAGPASGSAAAPTCRTLTRLDVPTAPSTLCTFNTPVNVTGTTSISTLNSCSIPAGTMGLNSRIKYTAGTNQGANSGTCNYQVFFSNSATAGTGQTTGGAAQAASRGGQLMGQCANANSLSSQMCSGTVLFGSALSSVSDKPQSYNTASVTVFINFNVTLSNSADTCTMEEGDVTLWP